LYLIQQDDSQAPKGPNMPAAFIEHVNVTVADPERSAQLMIVHVGDDRVYMAFYREPDPGPIRWPKGAPLNHVAMVVDDLDDVERRVIAAGLEPFSHGDYDPGRRFYFFDHDGIEYEMASYA
jgi:hypothetical protein